MDWTGEWANQYGSTLRITDDSNGTVSGTFRTALADSGFFGEELAVSGIHHGNCISFAFAGKTKGGDAICSFTGLLRGGVIETLWFVLADGHRQGDAVVERNWAHAASTNHDTFTRRRTRA
jgi:hypothetical protein